MARFALHDPRLCNIAGGAESFEIEIALNLLRHGHDVHIVTSEAPASRLFQAFAEQFPASRIHRLSPAPPLSRDDGSMELYRSDPLAPLALDFGRRAAGLYAQMKFEAIITTFLPDLHFLPAGEKYIFHVFGTPSSAQALLEQDALSKAHLLIPVSDFIWGAFGKLFPAAGSITKRIVYPWLGEAFFEPREDKVRDIDICYIGRLKERKGIRELLIAIGSLRKATRLSLRTTIVGEGNREYLFNLRQICEENGLSDLVVFAGSCAQDDVIRYLDRTKVFVYPTLLPEAFAMAPLEAMARGAAVVSSNLGGTRSYMNARNHVAPGGSDASALAQAIAKVLGDEKKRAEIAQVGIETAQRFTLARQWPILEEAYLSVCAA